MNPVDHLFVLVLFFILPLYDTVSFRRYVTNIEAGGNQSTVRQFTEIIIRGWVALAVLLASWLYLERPLAWLGFTTPSGTGFWACLAVAVAGICLLVYSNRSASSLTEEDRNKFIEGLGSLRYFVPSKPSDLHPFYGVAVTAGVVEEIIYRGFVIWYLSSMMPVCVAAGMSSFFFGCAHLYQGPAGAIRAGIGGLIMSVIYIFSGSIWLPIVVHILADGLQGPMFVRIFSDYRNDSIQQIRPEAAH